MHTKVFEITAQELEFLEEGRDTLRDIIQGRVSERGDEARKALAALLCIMPKMVSTWDDQGVS